MIPEKHIGWANIVPGLEDLSSVQPDNMQTQGDSYTPLRTVSRILPIDGCLRNFLLSCAIPLTLKARKTRNCPDFKIIAFMVFIHPGT